MNIKTYIVNLEESVERRNYVLKETAQFRFMDIELVKAVNGKQMSDEEIDREFDLKKFVDRYRRYPVKGEIGCTLSHRECYRRLLSTDLQYALILEDDVAFIVPKDVELVIGQGIRLLEEGGTDLVLFIPRTLLYNKPEPINEKYTIYPVYLADETCCYLINRRGAAELLKNVRPSIVADDFKFMRKIGIRIKTIYPNIVQGLSTVKKVEAIINHTEREQKQREKVKQIFWYRIFTSLMYRYIKYMLDKKRLIDRGWGSRLTCL